MPGLAFDHPTLLIVAPLALVLIVLIHASRDAGGQGLDRRRSWQGYLRFIRGRSGENSLRSSPRRGDRNQGEALSGRSGRRLSPGMRPGTQPALPGTRSPLRAGEGTGTGWFPARQVRRSARVQIERFARVLPFPARLRANRETLALVIRLVLILLVALALAEPRLYTTTSRQAVVFDADLSASVGAEVPAEQSWIDRALSSRQPNDLAGIVVAGRDPLAELAVSASPQFQAFQSAPDRDWTNLAGSMSLAAAMLPPGARRRVVLLTDGWQNVGDAVQQARLLRAEGIVVDVVPIAAPTGPEVRVDSVSAPDTVGAGEHFGLTVNVTSTVDEQAIVRVFVDGAPSGSQSVSLRPGEQGLSLPQTAPRAGTHRYRVDLEPSADSIAQNNTGQAIVNVAGPPRVVIAEGASGNGHNVAAALQASGFQVTTISASTLPISASGLDDYDAVVLVDVPARDLGPTRMAALQTFVRDLGRGLLVLGGENSYGLGAYAATPLEQALPVTMEIPQRKEIPTVAVALVIENLENSAGNDVAKEAAKKVVEQLTPRDEVMVSDAATGFPVPLQHVSDPAAIEKSIDAMQTGDPPSYAPYLANAANALLGSDAKVKHIIVVGDGDAQDNYEPLIKQIVDHGITVSAVATAAHEFVDAPAMQDIARWGHGRYYEATDFNVPQALLKEARTVIRPALIEDHFVPEAIGGSSLLAGLPTLPALDGYVAVTARPLASVALISDQGDPILASWQYGAGRSVAWTSDANGLWTTGMIRLPAASQLWSQLAEWILPASSDPDWHLTTAANGPNGEIIAETDNLGSAPAKLNGQIVGPADTATTATLVPVAPGRYVAEFPIDAPGAYSVHVLSSAPGGPAALDGQIVVPYSPEYRTTGLNESLLEAVAHAGGGRLLQDPAQAFADDLPAAAGGAPLWRWLLAAAACLLVFDVAVRRLKLGGRDLEPAFDSVRRLAVAVTRLRMSEPSADPDLSSSASQSAAQAIPEGLPHGAPPATQEPDLTREGDTLHTARLLAARRNQAGRKGRSDR